MYIIYILYCMMYIIYILTLCYSIYFVLKFLTIFKSPFYCMNKTFEKCKTVFTIYIRHKGTWNNDKSCGSMIIDTSNWLDRGIRKKNKRGKKTINRFLLYGQKNKKKKTVRRNILYVCRMIEKADNRALSR